MDAFLVDFLDKFTYENLSAGDLLMFIVNKKDRLDSIILFTLATNEYVRSKISYYFKYNNKRN